MQPISSSELRYRDFFEKVPVGLFAISPGGRILDANPAMVGILRYASREQLLAADIAEFQIDRTDAARMWGILRDGGEIRDLEVQLAREDGSMVWLLTSASAARDEEGQVLYYRGAVEDITGRKQAEEAVLESERRFETFMDHMPVIAFIKDDQGRYEYANEPLLRFLKKQRHEIYGHSDFEILSPKVAEPLRQHDRAVVEKRIAMETTEHVTGPDGETRTFMVLKFPITDPSERNFVGGFAMDITDRRRAEEAERRIARRFCDLFESSPDAIFVQDLEGNILDANPAACALCGETHGELVGRNMAGLMPAESLEELLGGVPRLARGEVVHAETVIRGGNGRATPVAISGSRIEFTGRPALLLHARDTSEQKRLQEQFYQSQKMEAIGRLAGGIAHDFNNLLTAIIGYNEIVLGGLNERDPLRRSSEEVRMAAERAARLTKQLLAVSRKQTLQPRIVDMNAVATDIEKMLRRLIGDDVELSVIPSPKSACVRADPSQIEQVLINLAVNARDAMPSGGQLFVRVSSIALSTPPDDAPDLAPGNYIVLRVTDTGSGMSEEIRERVFEPFFTTKDPGKGTGLGLATSYGIIKQSGGRILCDSAPNRGATFSIYLPQVLGTADAVRPEAGAAPLPRGTESILVVEDAVGVRGLATRILRGLGYRLMEAENGFDALSVISRHGIGSIDLILTDVTMPKMGGRELVERIRAEHPGTRVVFTSGAPGADAALKALFSHPSTAFLQKPFTPSDLARVVRSVMGPAHHNGSGFLPAVALDR
ncbi:MAG TPA: PAS domain S-box protein [Chthoniobacteraceae bacterium]|jgi:PAS domain S-box-containing protein|nr:PAS domain S-box protein [Chthoniobacteraceae bacterium]